MLGKEISVASGSALRLTRPALPFCWSSVRVPFAAPAVAAVPPKQSLTT